MNIKRIAVAIPLLVILGGCELRSQSSPTQMTDQLTPLGGYMYVWTDQETGCQYLVVSRGAGITPRLNKYRHPMCSQ